MNDKDSERRELDIELIKQADKHCQFDNIIVIREDEELDVGKIAPIQKYKTRKIISVK